jgi:hypothetical protein
MDKIDLKLIELLQKNARYSLKYLAKQVFLSTTSCFVTYFKIGGKRDNYRIFCKGQSTKIGI